jgi:hypothetical protein
MSFLIVCPHCDTPKLAEQSEWDEPILCPSCGLEMTFTTLESTIKEAVPPLAVMDDSLSETKDEESPLDAIILPLQYDSNLHIEPSSLSYESQAYQDAPRAMSGSNLVVITLAVIFFLFLASVALLCLSVFMVGTPDLDFSYEPEPSYRCEPLKDQ